MSYFNRREWLALDTFLEANPRARVLLEYLYDHPQIEHTMDSVVEHSGFDVTFVELKSLFSLRVLTATDSDGTPVKLAWDLQDSSRYSVIREKSELVRTVLENHGHAVPSGQQAARSGSGESQIH